MRLSKVIGAALAGVCLLAMIGCDARDDASTPATAPSPGVAAGEANARQAILRLEQEWTAALARKDLAWYERNVAPEYRTILASGRVVPRSEVVAHVRDSPPARDLKLEGVEVRLYGKTAVSVVTQSFTLEGGKPGRLRITDVWKAMPNGRWVVVHSHESSLAAEQPQPPGD